MLAAVLAIAVGLAAIVSNLTWVANGAVLVCVALLGLAAVGAFVGQGQTRVFCAGFAVFGGIYAGLLWDESASQSGRAFANPSPTAQALAWLAAFRKAPPRVGNVVNARWPNNGSYYQAIVIEYNAEEDLYLVQWTDGSTPSWLPHAQMQPVDHATLRSGHAVCAMLLGAVGGIVACVCFGERQQAAPPEVGASL